MQTFAKTQKADSCLIKYLKDNILIHILIN